MTMITDDDISFIGDGLARPECVLATAAGDLYASHAPADGPKGVTRVAPDGRQTLYAATSGDIPDHLVINGYSMMPDGSFLIANVGDSGGVFRLHRDGRMQAVLTEIDGRRLPSTNFANHDEQGRIWISVSTWHEPRDLAFRRGVADGFIILIDGRGPRIVADGIGFTNENKVDPSGRWLYVHETWGRRLSRQPIRDDNSLGPRETVAEYGDGIFPDGFEFDAEGGVWCTSVVSNRIVRVAPDGEQQLVYDTADPDLVAEAEAAYAEDRFDRSILNKGHAHALGNCASIGFGGPDLKTAYVGSLACPRIACFRSPVAGAVPAHWHF